MSPHLRGVALVLMAGLLWSFIGLVVRLIESADTTAVVFWRSLGMVPMVLAFFWWRGGGRLFPALRAVGLPGIVAGFGITLAYLGAIFALQRTTVANAVFLYSVAPFFAAILGRIVLGEKVRVLTWATMALAAFGIFVMIDGAAPGQGSMAGNLAALGSALGFAIFTVALRYGRVSDMMPANLIGAAISMAAAALLAPLFGQSIGAPLPDILTAMAMGVVILGGGMIAFTLGSRALPAAEMTLLTGIENVLAPVWVFLFLGEAVEPRTLLGGAMVLAAVMLNAGLGAGRPSPTPH